MHVTGSSRCVSPFRQRGDRPGAPAGHDGAAGGRAGRRRRRELVGVDSLVNIGGKRNGELLRNGFLPGFAIGLGAASIEVLYAGFGLAGVGKLLDVPVLRTVLGLAGASVMAYLGFRSVRAAFTEPSPASSPTAPPTSEKRPRADQTRLTRYHAPTR
ncbi:LysE family transporter [Streptomyces olivaceoviridis]